MKKIIHLSHTDISSDSRILKEIDAATDIGFQVMAFGLEKRNSSKASLNNHSYNLYSFKLLSRKLTFFPSFLRHALSLIEMFLLLFFKSIKFKPDIIHCNDNLMLPIAVILKLFTRAKLVYDAHELESDKNGTKKFQGRMVFYTEKICWSFIDALIVVTPSIKNWYNENIGKKKTVIVMNSPVIVENTSNNNYLREYFDIPDKSKIFLYIGGFMLGRGFDVIIDIFMNQEIESSFVMLGHGSLEIELNKIAKASDKIFVLVFFSLLC